MLAPAIASGIQSQIHSGWHTIHGVAEVPGAVGERQHTAHARRLELLRAGARSGCCSRATRVYLDLSPAVDQLKAALQSRGLTRVADAIPPTVDGKIELVQSDGPHQRAARAIRLLKATAIVMPILALLCLIGSVLLTHPWRRGMLHAGDRRRAAMLILIAALAVARSAYLDALGNGALPRDAASDIFDTLVAFLRHGVRIVVVVALVLAVVSFIAGLPLKATRRCALVDERAGGGSPRTAT